MKIQHYLDKGVGECWLRDARIGALIVSGIKYFEGTRYTSHAWCVMPNHVHWVLTPKANGESKQVDSDLVSILHSLKSYTAHEANKILNRSGAFWSREYYDHAIRSDEEFGRLVDYTIGNPVKARLCKVWKDWPWTGCSETIRRLLQ